MNKGEAIELAKTQIAGALVKADTMDEAARIYSELREFLLRAFDWQITELIEEQKRNKKKPTTITDIPKCKECRSFVSCPGEKIIFHRSSGTPCEEFKTI